MASVLVEASLTTLALAVPFDQGKTPEGFGWLRNLVFYLQEWHSSNASRYLGCQLCFLAKADLHNLGVGWFDIVTSYYLHKLTMRTAYYTWSCLREWLGSSYRGT